MGCTPMTGFIPRTDLLSAGALVLMIVAGVGGGAVVPAGAQSFDVPPGFESVIERDRSPNRDWRGLLTVRPDPGPFSQLSSLHLREVTSGVPDPDAWLRARMSADIGDEKAARSMLDSPDSPFGDPAFDGLREALPQVFRQLEELSQLPLDFCDGPSAAYNAAGPLRELYCVFPVGPFRRFVVLRLQEIDGIWYYTEIRAMNEKRLRHLLAIANSFRVRP